MRIFIAIIGLFLSQGLVAQKYITKAGKTSFKASVPAFEPVEAESTSTTAVLNTENGELAALMFVKSFHFEIALMEEHFNENYMDSDKYPKATFKGQAVDFDLSKLTMEPTVLPIKGTLTVRDIAKEIETQATFIRTSTGINVTTAFDVSPADFDIDIPSIVRQKISESIHITAEYELKEN